MTVAATAPDSAPDRARPMPMMKAKTSTTATAHNIASQGLMSTSTRPNGASGMRFSFSSGEMASTAKA